MKFQYLLLCAIVACGIAACGGNAAAPALPSASAAPASVAHAPVSFTVFVPAQPSAAGSVRKRHYISPNTTSIAVTVDGATTTNALTPNSPGCAATTGSNPGTTCTFSMTVAVGTDKAFVVTTYDTNGDALSTDSLTNQTVVLDQANAFTLTLDGIVASVVFQYTTPPACTATAVPVTIVAKDASGATIVGSAPYESPVTVTYTDPTGNSTFTGATTATKPGTGGGTVNYNGDYEPGSTLNTTASYEAGGTFTASANSTVLNTGAFSTIPTVCNEYALNPTTIPVPGVTTAPGVTLLPEYMTLGSDGNIYLAEQRLGDLTEIMTTATTRGTAVELPLTGPTTAGDVTSAILCPIVGPDGQFWITDIDNGLDTVPASPAVGVGVQHTYQNATTPYKPDIIANGPDGNLWFTDSNDQQLGNSTTAGVLSAPVAMPHLQAQFNGIVASHDKSAMWVAEAGSNMIARVPLTPPANGPAFTEYSVANSLSLGSSSPGYLASSNDGYIWFANQDAYIGRLRESDGHVDVYPLPDSNAFTYTIALGADGNMWATYIAQGQDYIARIIASGSAIGTITKYPILRTGNFATFSIVAGPSPTNDLWFDEVVNGQEKIGYLTI